MICYSKIDEKILSKVKLIAKASKNKKIRQKHKINAGVAFIRSGNNGSKGIQQIWQLNEIQLQLGHAVI